MSTSNKKKADQLGMPQGTAQAKLRKSLLFSMAGRLNELICHRCNKDIESIDEFSIEHKESWLDSGKAVELYFDLNNIAFSHLSCNVASGRRPHKRYFTEEDKLEAMRKNSRDSKRRAYDPEKRRNKFLLKGY